MLAIALALGSSLIYGVSDFLGGLKSRSLPLLSVLLISQGSALLVLVAIVLAIGDAPPDGRYLLLGVLAGLSEAVGVAALYRGLAVGVVSVVAPIGAVAPVVPVAAAGVLGELPAAIEGGGLVLALVGIAIVSYSRAGPDEDGDITPSVVFGALTALGFGGFLAAMDGASEGGVTWALLMARLTSVAVFVVAFLITRPGLHARPAEVPLLALIGLLVIAADALYALATTEGLLSVVAVLSSLYPVVTIGLAYIYLHERVEPLQRVGIVITLGGVVVISAA